MTHIITMRNADGTHYYSGLSWSTDHFEALVFDTEALADEEIEHIKRECADQIGVGDYGIYQLKVSGFDPTLRVIGSTVTDEDWDSHTVYTILETQGLTTDAQLKELIAERFPTTRCEHEHDCCGQLYAGPAQWSRTSLPDYTRDEKTAASTVLVKQGFHRNV